MEVARNLHQQSTKNNVNPLCHSLTDSQTILILKTKKASSPPRRRTHRDEGELLGWHADADLPEVLSIHVVLERHDVALLLRAEGAGYAAAEEDVLLCLLATGEARGAVAVQVDRKVTV